MTLRPGRRALGGATLAALLAACGAVPEVPSQPHRSILQILAGDSAFERFIEAANRGSAAAALAGPGPITVFVFTNAGWDALPAFTRQELLATGDALRTQALMYSLIVDGRHTIAGMAGQQVTLTSRNGTRIAVDARDPRQAAVSSAGGTGLGVGLGSIGLRDARLTRPDIEAANGVLHVMSSIIVP